MTTNAGAEALNRNAIGFSTAPTAGDELADIKRMFTPEFRNRLDAIISFIPLSRDGIFRVGTKFLMQLEGQINHKPGAALFSPGFSAPQAPLGVDPARDAPPMQL